MRRCTANFSGVLIVPKLWPQTPLDICILQVPECDTWQSDRRPMSPNAVLNASQKITP